MATPLQYAPDKVQKILVGNKSDEVEKRQVATAQGIKVGPFIFTCRLRVFFLYFSCKNIRNTLYCVTFSVKSLAFLTYIYQNTYI